MATEPAAPGAARGRSTLRLIAAFKLAKAVLLTTVAVKVLRLVHEDLELAGYTLAMHLHVDPEGRLAEPILRRLIGIEPHALTRFSLGALAYAALLFTEGIGLLSGKRWAEYLTIVATASLVPFELYELIRRLTVPRVLALAVNVAIVVYLVVRVRRERHDAAG